MFECEFCCKKFKKVFNLEYHKKTTKKCLKIQEESINTCNICKIKVEPDGLLLHIKTCIQTLKNENSLLKEQLDLQLDENKRLQDQLFKLAEIGTKKKTVVINNRVGRIDQRVLNQLAPYTITQEKVSKIVNEKFDKSYLTSKERGLAKFALDNLLRDENGKPQMICTDPARRNFLYKNNEDEIFKDPDATNFTDMYINPVEKKSGEIIRESEELNEEDYNLLIECLDTFEKIRKNRSVFTRHLAKKLSLKHE